MPVIGVPHRGHGPLLLEGVAKGTARPDFEPAMLNVLLVHLRFSAQTRAARYLLRHPLKGESRSPLTLLQSHHAHSSHACKFGAAARKKRLNIFH